MKEIGILDEILSKIGSFGPKQLFIFTQLCLIIFLNSAGHIAFVFTAMDTDYRCFIQNCDKNIPDYEEKWINNAIPYVDNKYLKCERYNFSENSTNCTIKENFNRNQIEKCNKFVFKDNTKFIAREFNLLCSENLWKLSLVGSMNTAGLFFGLVCSGIIADRFGRKFILIIGTFTSGIIGFTKTFSPNFYIFCILEFVEQFFGGGSYCSAFILGTEMVSPEKRKIIGCAIFTIYALGEVYTGTLAWLFKDWRFMIYSISIPTILTISFYWTIPESFRWYLSKGEIQKSKEILNQFSKSNGKTIPDELLNELNSFEPHENTKNNMSFVKMLKSVTILVRFLICAFLWISCAFLYYGITLNAVNITENSYMDFISISLIEIPAYWGSNYLMGKIGRKITISGSFFCTCISCGAFVLIEKSQEWLHILVYCLGKFGSTSAFYVIYFITTELFPTPLRQTSMGICSTLARLGSLTSPQTPLLSNIWQPLPLVMFSVIAAISGIISIILPETLNIKLPDTIKEAQSIGKKTEKIEEN